MNPSSQQTAMQVYAAENTQYRESPTEEQTAAGVVPLDTLPASWWNWLLHTLTSNNNYSRLAIADLRTELINVLTAAGITASSQSTSQLAQAIETIRKTLPSFDPISNDPIPGAVISSSDKNSVTVNSSTGKMIVNALSDWSSNNTVAGEIDSMQSSLLEHIADIDVSPIGGSGKYIESVSQENGFISATSKNINTLILAAHPKGTLYWTSDANFDPNTEWGGTWVRIKDTFVYAMGDNDTLNATGGAKTVTLSNANLPPHQHSFTPSGKIASTSGGTDNITAGAGAHTHRVLAGNSKESIGNVYPYSAIASNKTSTDASYTYYCTYGSTSKKYVEDSGNHNHSAYFTGTAGTTGDGGFANTAVDKMPPYICKYCWERTA